MMQRPEVSVVIPTRNRPELVPRAVRSALDQTLREIEVIVVVDGPDPSTGEALAAHADPRLRLVELPESGGAPAARNIGAKEATAPYVALLDDDDEWLPEKLATQLKLAQESEHRLPIVASRLSVRTPRAEFVIPRRLPEPAEPLSEYFSVRRGLFHGEGFIQTSTIFAPTELLLQVPFTPGLRRFQELDWTLRALQVEGVGVEYASEPLVVWYADENRQRISFDSPWRQSFEWLKESRDLVTPRAYAALAMSVVSSVAADSSNPRVFLDLLREAHKHGKPGITDYVTFMQVWLVPPRPRRAVRDFVLGRRRARESRTVTPMSEARTLSE
ncbi:glycosyltransferase family 2 protein [Rugosimonospora africana]|nr:glycosyltransferase family 2 protein [Rugosimonospora africana]